MEDMKTLFTYEVEAPKYRKEYIDRAKQDLDDKWDRQLTEAYQDMDFEIQRYDARQRLQVQSCQLLAFH